MSSTTALARFVFSFRLCHFVMQKSSSIETKEKMERKKGTVQATISLKGEQLHRVDVPGSGTCSLARGMRKAKATERTEGAMLY